MHNGSAFILDCGRGPFVVTAAHVFSQFVADKKNARSITSQIGNVAFDLSDRLIDCGTDRRIDIATFHIDQSEIAQLGKQTVIAKAIFQNLFESVEVFQTDFH